MEASQAQPGAQRALRVRGAVTAGLAVLLWHFSLPAILVLVALDGTAALAASALLRAEVARARTRLGRAGRRRERRRDELDASRAEEAERQANAALNVAFSTTFVLGPALGGAVVAAAGAPAALFIDVGSFLVCGALLVDLHPHVEECRRGLRARAPASGLASTSQGSDAAAAVPRRGSSRSSSSSRGRRSRSPYVKSTLGAGDRGVGLLLTMWGAGAVLGSVVFARLVNAAAGRAARAPARCASAVRVSRPRRCPVAGARLRRRPPRRNRQRHAVALADQRRAAADPEHLHGRLMGAVESLGALCVAIGLPLGGALVALSSPRTAFVIVGVGARSRRSRCCRVRIAGGARRRRRSPRSRPQARPRGPRPGSVAADRRALFDRRSN